MAREACGLLCISLMAETNTPCGRLLIMRGFSTRTTQAANENLSHRIARMGPLGHPSRSLLLHARIAQASAALQRAQSARCQRPTADRRLAHQVQEGRGMKHWLHTLFCLACISAGCSLLSSLSGVHVSFTTVLAVAAIHIALKREPHRSIGEPNDDVTGTDGASDCAGRS